MLFFSALTCMVPTCMCVFSLTAPTACAHLFLQPFSQCHWTVSISGTMILCWGGGDFGHSGVCQKSWALAAAPPQGKLMLALNPVASFIPHVGNYWSKKQCASYSNNRFHSEVGQNFPVFDCDQTSHLIQCCCWHPAGLNCTISKHRQFLSPQPLPPAPCSYPSLTALVFGTCYNWIHFSECLITFFWAVWTFPSGFIPIFKLSNVHTTASPPRAVKHSLGISIGSGISASWR